MKYGKRERLRDLQAMVIVSLVAACFALLWSELQERQSPIVDTRDGAIEAK